MWNRFRLFFFLTSVFFPNFFYSQIIGNDTIFSCQGETLTVKADFSYPDTVVFPYTKISGTELFVSNSGSDLSGTGSFLTPFQTIQKAIDVSVNGEIVTILDGEYTGYGNVNLSTRGKSIVVQSQNGPQKVKIDCQFNSRAFKINQGETKTTLIKGITILNGNPNAIPLGIGAAIFVEDNSGIGVLDCFFVNNSKLCISFGDNEVVGPDSFVKNSIFADNNERCIVSSKKSFLVEDCLFTHNQFSIGGNGHVANPAQFWKNCVFYCNYSNDVILALGHGKVLENSLFVNNSSNWGTVYTGTNWSGMNTVKNCTFYNNSNAYYDSRWNDHKGQVISSIFYPGVARHHISGKQNQINYQYSLGLGITGNGNISGNPLFNNPSNYDFGLQSGSPCIGSGLSGVDMGLNQNLLKNWMFNFIDYTVNFDLVWQDSSVLDSVVFTVDSSGFYYLDYYDCLGNKFTDSVYIQSTSRSSILISDTITSCDQDSVILDAGSGFASYNWINGDSNQISYAKATGMYSVEVTDTNGCTAEDSVFVSIINGNILQNDTIICKGDSVILSVSQPISQALTICNSSNLPSNLQTGLVGYWPFCGNANDESGNGNNGTVNGATLTTDKFGNTNSAYDFSGSAQTIQLTNALIPGGQNSSFTIQTRVKFDNINNSPNIWGKTLFWGEVNFSVSNTGEVALQWANSITGNKYSVIKSNPGIIQPNFWYDIVVSFQNNQAIIFVNGNSISTNYFWVAQGGSVLSTSRVENSCNFNQDPNSSKFGARITSGRLGNYLDGSIDEFTVWNRALSNNEISQIYSPYFYNSNSQIYSNSYQWSTGDTTSNIFVSPDSTTTYYVTISNGIHSCVDSVTVTVNNPQFQFPQDTITSCDQDSVLLDAGSGFASYNWSNGDSTQTTYAKSIGIYSVEVTDTNGCTAEDSVFVSIINDSILQNDTIICKGDSLILSVSQPISQALTICNSSNLPSNLQTGLVGYWPFCGNANDESGNGNNGTVNGATLTTDRFGNPNSAYDFDGVNDYISVANSTRLNLNDELTIQAWIKGRKVVSSGPISGGRDLIPLVSKWIGSGNQDNSFLFSIQGNILTCGIASSISSNVTQAVSQSPHSLVVNNWHSLTYVKDSLYGTLFVDGVQVARVNLGNFNINNSSYNLFFGNWYHHIVNSYQTFQGSMDDIGIWNRALSDSEVQQLFSGGSLQTYQWSTGDTTSTISVSPDSTTTYYVTISNGIHSCVDSVTVTVNNLQFQFAQDTITSCDQDSVILDAGSGFASYNWSNGDSNQISYAKATGMYSVEVTDTNGCTAEDSVFVSIINDSILQNDTIICKGDSLILSVSQPISQALTICNSSNLPSNLQTGLVGYWPFCGNANDESGNGNNGTVQGPILTSDRFGNASGAYEFDGIDDFISIPTEIMNGNDTVLSSSYRVRFMVDSIGASEQTIWNKDGYWREMRIRVHPDSSISLLWAYHTPKYYDGIKTLPGKIIPGNWYDVFIVLDSNNGEIFINGVKELTYAQSVGNSTISFSQQGSYCAVGGIECNRFGLAKWGPGISRYFNGKLDEIAIWNRALSQTEMQQLTASVSGSPSTNSGFRMSFQWSTGDTTSIISVSPDSTTTYYVTISNGIHSCADSVTVTVNNPQFQFAQDSVTGCDTVTVNAGAGWNSYSWSSGDTTQSVSFTTTGMKILTVTDSIGCTATDSIYVTVNTFVTTTIADTSCDQYTWPQTGITYGTSGVYRDTVPTAFGCDSILELVLTITNSTFSSDTVVACESYLWPQTGVTYFTTGIYFDTMLNAVGCDSIVALDLTIHYSTSSVVNQTACDSFSWPQTGLTYFVSGTYSDTLLNSNGCDSVVFLNLLVYPTITPIIGAVQNMCENDPVFNISSSPVGGVWSGPGVSPTGSFDPTVSGVGVHTIVYTAAGQCANSDTVTIEVFEVPLVDDRISDDECDEGKGSIELTISGGTPPYSYLWSNGKTSKDNLRLKEGTYSLTVTDSNGCIENYIGSLLNLEDDSCDDTYLFVPNVFSPDGNGVNDVLFVDGKNILSVNLQIYNRWGNLVFESNSLTKGWDGMYQGKPVNQGVFVYLVTGRYKDGEEFEQKGTITVVR